MCGAVCVRAFECICACVHVCIRASVTRAISDTAVLHANVSRTHSRAHTRPHSLYTRRAPCHEFPGLHTLSLCRARARVFCASSSPPPLHPLSSATLSPTSRRTCLARSCISFCFRSNDDCSLWQWLQQRTGFGKGSKAIFSSPEQSKQKIRPQQRQWCLPLKALKAVSVAWMYTCLRVRSGRRDGESEVKGRAGWRARCLRNKAGALERFRKARCCMRACHAAMSQCGNDAMTHYARD